ncbi:hypothetical protein ACFQVD_26250 [Streptosporangium amethystogenes subsp. fukuiense]|uniref:Uncharacterized protein n=1 Tax=Streptosporangium amethystogenes subsp. fukuiense TaxID=698418 RepID=A0ABW2T651_9ACTN
MNAPEIEHGVRWTPGPDRHPTVTPNLDSPAAARAQARRTRALQQVFGNATDAVVVYRLPDGAWVTRRWRRQLPAGRLVWRADRDPLGLPRRADRKVQRLLDKLRNPPTTP